MSRGLYKFLKYTAIVMALLWASWGIYDSFVSGRDPGDADYHAANRLFEDGHYDRALQHYEDALTKNQQNIHALRGKARTLLQLERHDEALRTFDEAISLEPEFGGTYANRGILYDRMGDYQKALSDYLLALELDPEIAEGPHWLIRFLRNQPEKPPGIAERAQYIFSELQKPASERLLSVPELDAEQRSYKK